MFGHLQSHLSAEKKTFKPSKTDSSPKERKSPVTAAVSKKGSRIQVVSNTKSPRSRSPIRSLSSRTGSMPKLGGMRCDMEEHQTKKPAIQRTNVSRTSVRGMTGMTFKVESRENEFIGIDLKKVSLKRKIKNDDSTTEIGGLGQIKRTVANKREKRHSSDEEIVPKKSSRSVTEKEKGRAIYKTALNDLMENRKKTKMDSESRKRISRDKMRKMKEKGDSSDSDSPAPSPTKRKKPSKKTKKVTSSEESESENENVTRRPGERGKSAIKEIQDDGEDDAYSPIEGYRLKVSNLNSSVSESDLVDLFCAIGAIRDANSLPIRVLQLLRLLNELLQWLLSQNITDANLTNKKYQLLLIVLWIYHQRSHINGEMNIQRRNHASDKSLLVKLAILYFLQHWPVLFNQVPNRLFSRSKYDKISKLVLCIAFSRSTIRL